MLRESLRSTDAPRRPGAKRAAALALMLALAACDNGEQSPTSGQEEAYSTPKATATAESRPTTKNPEAQQSLSPEQAAIAAILTGTTCRIDTSSIDDKGNDGRTITTSDGKEVPHSNDTRSITTTIVLQRTAAAVAAEQKYGDGTKIAIAKVFDIGYRNTPGNRDTFNQIDWEYPESPYYQNLENPERNIILHPPASTNPNALDPDTQIIASLRTQVTPKGGDQTRYVSLIDCANSWTTANADGLGEQFGDYQWVGAENDHPAVPTRICGNPVIGDETNCS